MGQSVSSSRADGGVVFLPRSYPSGNSALLTGPRPVLIDSGFGASAGGLPAELRTFGVDSADLQLVVGSHWHSDHVGGHHLLGEQLGVPLAAHPSEASAINARHERACQAEWLDQPVQPFQVDVALDEGDVLDTGTVRARVLHTPGHTAGHLSFHVADAGLLILGDAAHGHDVGWINPFGEGPAALELAIDSVERLLSLQARVAMSGHGEIIEDPQAALERARAVYVRWRKQPEELAWHACKRIFVFALMIHGGVAADEVHNYLVGRPWLHDYALSCLGATVDEAAVELVQMLTSRGAIGVRDGRMVALVDHTPCVRGWAEGPTLPARWPPARVTGGHASMQ